MVISILKAYPCWERFMNRKTGKEKPSNSIRNSSIFGKMLILTPLKFRMQRDDRQD